MKLRHCYLILCVIGIVLPYWQFVPWVIEHGWNLSLFCHELFANRISGFFAMDVIVSAIVFFVFAGNESRRLAIRNQWLPVIATLAVGVSAGLPLFLYLRQVRLDHVAA